jgi:PAS domain S-box-containing protein
MDTATPLKILMVEDNEDDRALEERELRKAGISYQLLCVDKREHFIEQLKHFKADLILCDYSLPQFNALDALEICREISPEIPVIVVTGTLTDEMAVECLKKGAIDYVIKERIVRLPYAISRALEHRRMNLQRATDEERIRQSEKLLRVVTGVLPALLVYLSRDLHVQFCNRIYEKWFSVSNEQVLGLPLEQAFNQEISDQWILHLPRLVEGEAVQFEASISTGLEKRVVSLAVKPDMDPRGQARGFVCLMTDISSQKNYEEELLAAKVQADAANEAKSQFLANMSHEMRTPLSAMMGFAELLMTPEQEDEDRQDWLGRIVKNCERLRKMIDEILDLSKIEAGKLEVIRSKVAVPEVINQVRSTLFPLALEKRLDLVFEVSGEIPGVIESDAVKLRHIFLNIIGNAIKFSDRGPVTVVAQMSTDGKLQFDVKDLGPGLTPQQSEHLFEPFSQVDSSMTRKAGGTGLGLALARRYARALGGDVQLTQSKPGKGSTFTIWVDPGEAAFSEKLSAFDAVDKKRSPQSSAQDFELSALRVLVVDDVYDNQVLVRRFLEKAGASVDVASDGEEAVEKALHQDYDLVLMDLQMPVLDGYNATSQLREQGYEKPIIALTAHALRDEKNRCLKMGFNGFLTKPIRQSDLLSRVSEFRH